MGLNFTPPTTSATPTGSTGLNFTPPTGNGTPAPQQSLGQSIWNNIAVPIGQQIQSGADQLTSTMGDIKNGQGNPFMNGLNLLNGLATGASAVLAPAFKVFTDAMNDPTAQNKPGTVQNAYNQITNNPDFQKFAMTPQGQMTSKILDVVAKSANVSGTALGLGAGIDESMNPTVKTPTTPTTGASPDITTQTVQEARANPLTPKETAMADLQGRTEMVNGVKQTTTPSPKEIGMDNALKPLVDEGAITTPKDPLTNLIKGGAQKSNLLAVSDELENQTAQIRAEAEINDTNTGNKFDDVKANELKGQLDQIKPPQTLKSDTALQSRMSDFNDAVKDIIDKEQAKGTGATEAKLNIRQAVDKLINQEMPKTFSDTPDRISTAMEQHADNVRELLNQSAADEFSNGKMKDGTDYRSALRNQSNLIDAQGEMAEKYAREYPIGKGELARIAKAHPTLTQWAKRIALVGGIGFVTGGGIGAIGTDAHKVVAKLFGK